MANITSQNNTSHVERTSGSPVSYITVLVFVSDSSVYLAWMWMAAVQFSQSNVLTEVDGTISLKANGRFILFLFLSWI